MPLGPGHCRGFDWTLEKGPAKGEKEKLIGAEWPIDLVDELVLHLQISHEKIVKSR